MIALGRRLVVLLLVAALAFALLELAPGDAADAYLAATGGGDAGFAAAVRDEFGLAASLPVRFATYLGRVATLDLGTSVTFNRPVRDVLAERLPVTLLLGGASLVLTALGGAVLGALSARGPGGIVDRAIGTTVLVLNATPGFVVAVLLSLMFAVKLGWLPVGGLVSLRPTASPGLDLLAHAVLPVLTLTLTYLALFVRVVRGGLVAAAGAESVRFARAKGLAGWRLGWRHIVRPSLTPVVALAGVHAAALLSGSVVVETVFAVPGFGSLAAAAVASRDAVLLAGVVLTAAVLVMAANVAADWAVRRLDPRLSR